MSIKNAILVIAMSMGFTLAASTFTKMSVGFLIVGILTLVSRKSSSPLYECICQACILSSELFSNLFANFVKERSHIKRGVHFNIGIVLGNISLIVRKNKIFEVRFIYKPLLELRTWKY